MNSIHVYMYTHVCGQKYIHVYVCIQNVGKKGGGTRRVSGKEGG